MPTAQEPVTVIGNIASPYVRKVVAVLLLKDIPFRMDPIVPFLGDDRFTAVSPLRRVPVLIDNLVTLSDSSVICQYLEDRYPSPSAYPADIALRAQARWLEEYADTRMGDVFVWRIFNEAVTKPGLWGRTRDLEAIARAVEQDLPPVMDYLESVAPAGGFFGGGPISVADISVGVFFRNLHWARNPPDPARWPRTLAWVDRVVGTPVLSGITALADRVIRLPPDQQRALYPDAGIEATEDSVGGTVPRRGPMTV